MAFQKREIHGRIYQVFVPAGYVPSRRWPLVVFLHGIGENGTDGVRHLDAGLPPYVRSQAAAFPAFVLAPQCKGPWKFVGEDERVVMDAVAAAEREWSIDPKRIYLTGLSQGGCSTFDLGAKYPERWAALAVICGAGRAVDAPKLKAPTWIFHGELDPAVPPSGPHQWDAKDVGGRDMAARIPGARYTEYPGADHFIWDRVYADPALWDWLFEQRR
jgi:predicted peptidase